MQPSVELRGEMLVISQPKETMTGVVVLSRHEARVFLLLIEASLEGELPDGEPGSVANEEDATIDIRDDHVRICETANAGPEHIIGGPRQMMRDALQKGLDLTWPMPISAAISRSRSRNPSSGQPSNGPSYSASASMLFVQVIKSRMLALIVTQQVTIVNFAEAKSLHIIRWHLRENVAVRDK
jgi:hypothetical protein